MKPAKSSLSKAISYKDIGEFWDSHDLSEFWDRGKEVEGEVTIESEVTYYALDRQLSQEIQSTARRRGISADTLVNLWVQEKLQEEHGSMSA